MVIEFYNRASITCDLNRRHEVAITRQEYRPLNLMPHAELNQVNCQENIHHLLLESDSTIRGFMPGKSSQLNLKT